MVEQKQEQVEESETFLKWCYVGVNGFPCPNWRIIK